MKQRWTPPMDGRTKGFVAIDKSFTPNVDTLVPQREKIDQTWIDKLLDRQRMKTVWVNKRQVTVSAMLRRTINCRCAQVVVIPPEDSKRPHLQKGPVNASLKCSECKTIMSKFWAENPDNDHLNCMNPLCKTNKR